MDKNVVFIKTEQDVQESKPKPTWKERKVSISIGTLLTVLVVLLIASGGFVTGRYLYPLAMSSSPAIEVAPETEIVTDDTSEPEVEVVQAPPEPVVETPKVVEPDPPAPPKEPEPNPEIITTYTHSTLTITDVEHEYLTEQKFGRIREIKYTLANNEEGIIKVDHAYINIAGYEFPYKADVLLSERTIYPGKTMHGTVKARAAYSPKVIDPESATITLRLEDNMNRSIGTATTTKDLS